MLEGDRPTGDMVAEYLRIFQKLRRSFLWNEDSQDTMFDAIAYLRELIRLDDHLTDQRRCLNSHKRRLNRMRRLGHSVQQVAGQHENDLGIPLHVLGQVRAGVEELLASLRAAEVCLDRTDNALSLQWDNLMPRLDRLIQENPPLRGH